jgi:glycosyltransferase involved in cell wall biosynthesis
MTDRYFAEEVGSRFNAIILCTRNRPKEASSVLHQIHASEDRPELILVVDGSDDAQSLELQEDISDLSEVVFMRCAPGLTKQRNVGLAALPLNTGIVHFLDDDVEIQPDYFQVVERGFLDEPTAVGVGVRTADNVDNKPSRLKTFFLITSSKSGVLLRSGVNVGYRYHPELRQVDWLPGCTMAWRFSSIKGLTFDETKPGVGWGEDVDFSLKARTRGPLFLTCDTTVIHHKSPINRDSTGTRRNNDLKHRLQLAASKDVAVSKNAVLWSVVGENFLKNLYGSYLFLRSGAWSARRSLGDWGLSVRCLPRIVAAPVTSILEVRRIQKELERVSESLEGVAPLSSEDSVSTIPLESKPQRAVSVVLQGGLGNQLFGYAVGLEVATRLGVTLELNTSDFIRHSTLRNFALDGLLSDHVVQSGEQPVRFAFTERSFAYDEGIQHVVSGLALRGYFQSEKYFVSIADQVRNSIKAAFGPSAQVAGLQDSNFIGIQVRRGDYLDPYTHEFHGICDFEYFRRGLEITRGLVGDLPAVIFSDDQNTAEEFAKALPNACVDLALPDEAPMNVLARLSQASGFVISNSSFGWWGAWIAGPDRVVVAPRPWFTSRELQTQDLLPTHWLTLDRSSGH